MKSQTGMAAGLYYQVYAGLGPSAAAVGSAAPPLLVLPGLLSDGRQFRRLLRDLQRPAVVVDPLGCGFSELPAGGDAEYALARQADRLLVLLEQLELEVVDVAGISMGGMWAQHALLQAPQRFRRAVLVGTAARTEPRLRSVLLGLQAQWRAGVSLLDLWRMLQVLFFSADFLDRPGIIPMLESLATMEERPTGSILGQLEALLHHDLSAQLARLGNVRLVLAGAEDFVMPRGTQERLCQALGYGTPRLCPQAGHALWIEQPTLLAKELAAALA